MSANRKGSRSFEIAALKGSISNTYRRSTSIVASSSGDGGENGGDTRLNGVTNVARCGSRLGGDEGTEAGKDDRNGTHSYCLVCLFVC